MNAVAPLKRFCSEPPVYGLNVSADRYGGSGVRFLRTTDITVDGALSQNEGVYVDATDVPTEYLLRDGDLLLSRSGTLGRAMCVETAGFPTTHAGYLVRFRPNADTDPRYLWYCAQSDLMRNAIGADAVESTIGNFNAEKYANVRLPWVPYGEQRAIAGYLDRETARIDALIASRARLSALLDERVGVAFGTAMEEVGFRMPTSLSEPVLAHGEFRVPRLSQVLVQLTNGYVGPTRDILVDDGIRYVQSLHIKDGRIDFDRGHYFVTPEWHNERPRIHLRDGDVLIVQTGDIGQVAVVPPGFGEASCHALQIARVRRSMLSGPYLAAYLRSPFGRASLLSRATGALHPHLEAGIKDIPVVVPPKDIQDRVVRQVEAVQSDTHMIRSRIEQQVALLEERRQALITVAVTGGIEIQVAA